MEISDAQLQAQIRNIIAGLIWRILPSHFFFLRKVSLPSLEGLAPSFALLQSQKDSRALEVPSQNFEMVFSKRRTITSLKRQATISMEVLVSGHPE